MHCCHVGRLTDAPLFLAAVPTRPGQSTSEVGIHPLCACGGTQKCNVCRFVLFSFAMRPAQFCHMANLLQQQLVADLEPDLEVGQFQQQQQQQQQQQV